MSFKGEDRTVCSVKPHLGPCDSDAIRPAAPAMQSREGALPVLQKENQISPQNPQGPLEKDEKPEPLRGPGALCTASQNHILKSGRDAEVHSGCALPQQKATDTFKKTFKMG